MAEWPAGGMNHSAPVRLRLTTAVTAFTTTLEVPHWRNDQHPHLPQNKPKLVIIPILILIWLYLRHRPSWQPPPPHCLQPRPWWRPADRALGLSLSLSLSLSLCRHETRRASAALQPPDLKIINLWARAEGWVKYDNQWDNYGLVLSHDNT